MTAGHLWAIVMVFVVTSIAWFTLGTSVVRRTGESDEKLAKEVAQLWGGRHEQIAPDAWYEVQGMPTEAPEERTGEGRSPRPGNATSRRVPLLLDSNRIDVALGLDHRRKGLLWYDTYAVAFTADYTVHNPDSAARVVHLDFAFPSTQAVYDSFTFQLDGREVPFQSELSRGITASVSLPPGGEVRLRVGYRSRGLDTWTYCFGRSGAAQVKDFLLAMRTNFEAVDFPAGAMSPTTAARTASGRTLTWRFDNLVTGQKVGVDLPNRLNPGPLAARVTFFAPVSLLFFLTVMIISGLLKGQNLHPMNYFFLSAAFFSFHLLLAYLADHINIHLAFLVSAATSILLVTSYLRLVAGIRFALLQAGAAQSTFLVLFSYAFFFEGYTGLTVTVGAVLTLFLLMQLTARVDWTTVFTGPGAKPPLGTQA